MAKVRVYELARELNMDSKQLVEKLLAGGMSIKNYMSTLDETSVTKAKGIIAGTVSEVVEEKRIKPTIIRRRRKTVKVKPPEPPAPAPEKEEVEEVEPPVAEKTAPGVSPPIGKEVGPPKGKEVKPPKRKAAKKEEGPAPVEAVEVPPEEKAPASSEPVNIITLTCSSFSAQSTAYHSSKRPNGERAFFLDGQFIITVKIPFSSFSYLICLNSSIIIIKINQRE